MKMNPVVHFEMPMEDKKRVSDFYSKAFGWDMKVMGQEFGEYVLAMTTESNEKGPLKPGSINGGFFPKSDEKPGQQYPSVVISVDDIKEHMKKVIEAGGKVFDEPVEIPGVGMYVAVEDTEGNRLSMLQPKM